MVQPNVMQEDSSYQLLNRNIILGQFIDIQFFFSSSLSGEIPFMFSSIRRSMYTSVLFESLKNIENIFVRANLNSIYKNCTLLHSVSINCVPQCGSVTEKNSKQCS